MKLNECIIFLKAFILVILCLLFSGCVSNGIRNANQKLLNIAYNIPNLSSQGLNSIQGYCKTKGAVTWKNAYQCQTALVMSSYASEGLNKVKSYNSMELAGNSAVAAALQSAQGYMEVWRDAIEVSSHDKAYGNSKNWDFNDALQVATNIASSMGLDKVINEVDSSVLYQAKKYGTQEATSYAIAVHAVIELGISPRGSLASYAQQIQNARTQWESAKIALLLHASSR